MGNRSPFLAHMDQRLTRELLVFQIPPSSISPLSSTNIFKYLVSSFGDMGHTEFAKQMKMI